MMTKTLEKLTIVASIITLLIAWYILTSFDDETIKTMISHALASFVTLFLYIAVYAVISRGGRDE